MSPTWRGLTEDLKVSNALMSKEASAARSPPSGGNLGWVLSLAGASTPTVLSPTSSGSLGWGLSLEGARTPMYLAVCLLLLSLQDEDVVFYMREQCSQFRCQSVACITTMDPEKLLVPPFKRLIVMPMIAMRKKITKAVQGAKGPTWSQLEKLTTEAQQMIEKQGVEAAPSARFLAKLALGRGLAPAVALGSAAPNILAKDRRSRPPVVSCDPCRLPTGAQGGESLRPRLSWPWARRTQHPCYRSHEPTPSGFLQ
ncbi:hypothetical protein QTO34_006450 [Cnephaeus nilssonii]|uniref:Uncharacterized protein n=1 Tax=Cnephaeus nilssonii TaxID=3371016 RepID=A0AA40HKI9_CNENI|nr:hypothetical protein QTO34_006450 [Eptesicus nilssonii]